MTRQTLERNLQPWICQTCGTTNSAPHSTQCVVCFSPAPDARAKRRITRRTMLIGGLVTGATLLGGGGFWMASSLLSRRSQLQPGQAKWEVLLDPGSTLSGSGDLGAPALAWSPDGTSEAMGLGGNLLLSWLPDGHALATSWQQGELDIWDVRTGASLFHREPDAPSVSGSAGSEIPLFLSGPDAALAPNGQRAALYTLEQGQLVIQVWDLRTASPLFSCQPVAGQHWCLTWSPDGTYLAACQSNRSPASIRFWNASTGKLAFSYEALAFFPDRLTWSPNGRFLAEIDSQPASMFRAPATHTVLRVLEVR